MRGIAVVLTFVVIAFALFGAWWSNQRTDYFPAELQTTMVECEPGPGVRIREAVLDQGEDEWFSGVLSALHEPSLHRRLAGRPRSVRFTWIRSFHAPVVIRVDELSGGHRQLTARQSGEGTDPARARPPRALTRALTADEVRAFDAAVDASGLFARSSRHCDDGLDGARWIFESADPAEGYRFRQRWSPREGGELELGHFMLGLTGWDFEEIY